MNKRFSFSIAVFLIILVTAVSACNFPRPTSTPSTDDLVNTAAAQTIAVFNTELAANNPPTLPASSSTPGSGNTPSSSTAVPATTESSVEVSTFTPLPPTATSRPCNRAIFIGDASVPDNTVMYPGMKFTKSWELKNGGSCTWTSGYSIVFANEGNSMGGPAATPIQNTPVEPDETVIISVQLTAPANPGEYRGDWELRQDSTGEKFGSFYVQIVVIKEEEVEGEFEFNKRLCNAEWSNDEDKILDCPGVSGDEDGYTMLVANPKFENGYVDDETAMLTVPPNTKNAEIIGKFLPVSIPANAVFKTVIGCMYDATACNVKFTLKAQAEGETEKTLGEWTQTYDDDIEHISIDLATQGLTNKKVTFTFIVRSNIASDQNKAFWLRPMIIGHD